MKLSNNDDEMKPLRLIAFRESLSSSGMREIKNVLERRSVMFARKLNDFNVLNWQDQENVTHYSLKTHC